MELSLPVVSAGLCVLLAIVWMLFRKPSKQSKPESSSASPANENSAPQPAKNSSGAKKDKKEKHVVHHHPLQFAVAKGHQNVVTGVDLSVDGKVLCTVSEDRTIRLFAVSHLSDPQQKFVRINMEDEYATACAIDPTEKFVAVATQFSRSIRIHQLGAKNHDLVRTFKTGLTTPIDKLGWCRSNVLFVFSKQDGTSFHFFSTEGHELRTVATNQMLNFSAALVSTPTLSFVTVAAFTSDAKIWQVAFDKIGHFTGVNKVMDLKGHRSSIVSVCFSQDAKCVVTCSKDKTIRLWNIDVRFHEQEDPKLISSHDLDQVPRLVSLSPMKDVLVVGLDDSLHLYQLPGFKEIDVIAGNVGGTANQVIWSPNNNFFIASAEADKSTKLFRNPLHSGL